MVLGFVYFLEKEKKDFTVPHDLIACNDRTIIQVLFLMISQYAVFISFKQVGITPLSVIQKDKVNKAETYVIRAARMSQDDKVEDGNGKWSLAEIKSVSEAETYQNIHKFNAGFTMAWPCEVLRIIFEETPLCLMWVRVPLWPHVRQAKFCLRVCQVVFFGVLPFSSHLQIGPSHMS